MSAKTDTEQTSQRVKDRGQKHSGIPMRRLRELRKKAGLSVKELHIISAQKGGAVYKAQIRTLETGRRNAQPRTAEKLATALGVSVDDLRGEES